MDMSQVDELLDNFDDEDVYYDPQMSTLIPEGSYPATIVDLYSKKINTQRGNKGMLYKPKYRLDDTVRNYQNRDVQDSGVWRFFGTKDADGRRITGGSNAGYKKFLDKLHIPMEKIEVGESPSDEPRVIIKLPAITKDMILNKSVVISVHHEEWEGTHGRNITPVATLVRVRNGSLNGQVDS
jgi:hypothetical protein